MDNLLIAERSIRTIEKLKRRRLSDEFKMTDFGEATLFLGMRLAYNLECGDLNLKLFPETAVTKTLEKFGMTESNSTKNSVSRVAGQPKRSLGFVLPGQLPGKNPAIPDGKSLAGIKTGCWDYSSSEMQEQITRCIRRRYPTRSRLNSVLGKSEATKCLHVFKRGQIYCTRCSRIQNHLFGQNFGTHQLQEADGSCANLRE